MRARLPIDMHIKPQAKPHLTSSSTKGQTTSNPSPTQGPCIPKATTTSIYPCLLASNRTASQLSPDKHACTTLNNVSRPSGHTPLHDNSYNTLLDCRLHVSPQNCVPPTPLQVAPIGLHTYTCACLPNYLQKHTPQVHPCMVVYYTHKYATQHPCHFASTLGSFTLPHPTMPTLSWGLAPFAATP